MTIPVDSYLGAPEVCDGKDNDCDAYTYDATFTFDSTLNVTK